MTWQQAISAIIAKQRAANLEIFNQLIAELAVPKLLNISQVQSQFEELLGLANPLLGVISQAINIRASYRKLAALMNDCQRAECKTYYALTLLSLGLLMGDKDFMKESVLKAARALRASYPIEKDLGSLVVSKHLAPLMAKISKNNFRLSVEDLQELIGLINTANK